MHKPSPVRLSYPRRQGMPREPLTDSGTMPSELCEEPPSCARPTRERSKEQEHFPDPRVTAPGSLRPWQNRCMMGNSHLHGLSLSSGAAGQGLRQGCRRYLLSSWARAVDGLQKPDMLAAGGGWPRGQGRGLGPHGHLTLRETQWVSTCFLPGATPREAPSGASSQPRTDRMACSPHCARRQVPSHDSRSLPGPLLMVGIP